MTYPQTTMLTRRVMIVLYLQTPATSQQTQATSQQTQAISQQTPAT